MRRFIAIGASSFGAAGKEPVELLEHAGYTVMPNPYKRRMKETEIIAHLREAEGLIAGLEPLNENVLRSAKKLKALARVGIGMDNVDATAAAVLGIRVSSTPDGPTEAVAELCLTSLLAISRNLVPHSWHLPAATHARMRR